MRVGIASMSDPAHETYEARCPDCNGTGSEEVGPDEWDACRRCDGERFATDVEADEWVRVGCIDCDGTGERWHSPHRQTVCEACDGDGEVEGYAQDVAL